MLAQASKNSAGQRAKPLEAPAWKARQVASGRILVAKASYRASLDSKSAARGSTS